MKFTLSLFCLCLIGLASVPGQVIVRDSGSDRSTNGVIIYHEYHAAKERQAWIESRVADLLSRMSLEEKIGQLTQAHRQPDTATKSADRLRQGRISSFLDGSELIEDPKPRNRVQRVVVEQSPLGIPLIFGHDSILRSYVKTLYIFHPS